MLSKILLAWGLMATCVIAHAAGVTSAFRWLPAVPYRTGRFWHASGLFIRIAAWMILLHVAEIMVWACAYSWKGAVPGLQTALYFSAVTYTTTGYGDVVLPEAWRLVGAIEALTGILMCGWSTGFFFAAVSRIYEARA